MLGKRIRRLLIILAAGLILIYLVIYLAAWASVNETNPWANVIIGLAIVLFIVSRLYAIAKPVKSMINNLRDNPDQNTSPKS